MVFISKNINFTSKTNFSTEKILEMQFYSGKDGFYQEEQKFYFENEVFYSKNIRNAVLQWKIWLLSGKTEILPRKRCFLVTKIINAVLQWKRWFSSVKTEIL